MNAMSVPQFSRPGAVDLSSLRTPPQPAAGASDATAGAGGGPGSGRYVIAVGDEQTLRSDVVERSMSVVVLVSFWSPESAASVDINGSLSRLADEFDGRFLLATVDVAAHPELAQALGIPQVPLVVAALRGQLAPLIQDPLPDDQMRAMISQILQAAVSNGVAGRVDPVDDGDSTAAEAGVDDADAEPPSRFPEAEEALMSGDLDAAVQAFEEALSSNPGDPEATLGLGQAKLLKRTQGVDLNATREAAAQRPDDVAAQTLAADVELLGGHVDDAFGRLIDVVRRSAGDDRDQARQHLIELFSVVGDADPRVVRARQQLASALF
jgi:putative thioredoxin